MKTVLKGVWLSFCFAFFSWSLIAEPSRVVRFGVISDVHVCDKPDQSQVISVNASPRYFTGGLAKLEAFAEAMNKANAAFVVELGDFTDNPVDMSLPYEKRKAAALGFLEGAEAKLALFKGPRYHVMGNHDTDQLSKEDVSTKIVNGGTGEIIPKGKTYYSFDKGGIHFVVLDACYKADGNPYSGVPGSPGSGYSWSDANIPAVEVEWLKNDLASTKLPTIVFSHQLLCPLEQVDAAYDPAHSVKNAAEIRSILEKSGVVVAAFAGHYHDGGYMKVNGIHYVCLQANAAYGNDASYHNQYVLVDVYKDGKDIQITIAGNGNQKSYVLASTLK
ncbi:MAG: metallophosphoesterase [Treponemataceae bacterium]|nr:metallophosphoesterase [Treponemataceae bacterium]